MSVFGSSEQLNASSDGPKQPPTHPEKLPQPKRRQAEKGLKQAASQTAAAGQASAAQTGQQASPASPSAAVDMAANETAARASLSLAGETSKDELWAAGKSLLSQGGMPPAQCGSFVGKLCKDYGTQVALDAVRTAIVERPADPPAFLKAVCQRLVGKRCSGVLRSGQHFDTLDYGQGGKL